MSTILRSRAGSRLGRDLIKLLSPRSLVLAAPRDLLAYGYDATGQQGTPGAVVLPADTEDTARLMRYAAAHDLPVITRGAGTNLSGGTVPAAGGLVIETSRLNEVIAVDFPGRRIIVGPGLTNLALQEYLAPHGYAFAPDPASQKAATLGGNVAENAGGPHCLKYGVTADHVLGLTVVLAGGEVVRLGHGPGPDDGLAAVSALVGSEGTLGVFTELVLRLDPLPPAVQTILAVYDRLEDAGRTVSEIIARRMLPATLELMDRTTLLAVEESFNLGYPTDADGALLIEVDGPQPGLGRQIAEITAVCRRLGARSVAAARDEAERARLWRGRKAAFGALARRSPAYSVQDVTVPRDRLVEMMRGVATISRRYGLEVAVIAHAGDGNLHPIILHREAGAEQLARVHAATGEMMRLAVELGGTISGEHGIGLEKLDYLQLAVPPATIELMGRIKRCLDPRGGLNPGKVLPAKADNPATADNGPDAHPAAGRAAGVAARVRGAVAGNRRLRVLGGGSRQAPSPGAADGAKALRVTGLDNIIELAEANLTVTVGAGMPTPALTRALAARGLWLPPADHGWSGTIGGDVATAQPAPSDFAVGDIARWLLGATVVTGLGRAARLGGETMKNVAGYNLHGLLVGSYGRLGAITELVFRVWPQPEGDLTLWAGLPGLTDAFAADPGQLQRAWARLAHRTRPVAVAAVGRPGAAMDDRAAGPPRGEQPAVAVRLAGLDEDVAGAAGLWERELGLRRLPGEAARRLWRGWSSPLAAAGGGGRLMRFFLPPARLAEILDRFRAPGDWAMCLISGHGWAAGAAADPAAAASEAAGGRTRSCVNGSAPRQGPLDGRLCRAFDPAGVFAPAGDGRA